MGAIEKWQEVVRTGKKFKKNLHATNCTYCMHKKKTCELPTTEGMQALLVTGGSLKSADGRLKVAEGSVTPSVASSSKRKKTEIILEMPARKKTKTDPSEMKEEEFWAKLLAVLTGIDGRIKKVVAVGKEMVETAKKTKKFVHHTAVVMGQTSRTLVRIEEALARKGEEESEEEKSEKKQEVPIQDEREAEEKMEEEESEEEKAGARRVERKEGTEDEEMSRSGSEGDEESAAEAEDRKGEK